MPYRRAWTSGYGQTAEGGAGFHAGARGCDPVAGCVAAPSVSMSELNALSTRLDKWLWAARFFKTRQLAIEAVNAGHIELNGDRAKPAKSVKPGDEVTVRKPPYQYLLVVKAISEKRGSATVARELFTETAGSIAAREKLLAEQRAMPAPIFKGRPTKRDRRVLARFFETAEGEP